ncbi:hypothetical protein VSR01_00600 [Actinacidiphila sp. DG2A-62]|uniref:hypothetical protein n=1 Tax=Actinacidiphila sp. DG2A-62 TaxID=3108821 RepID=UPI002DB6829B|nr:hypothetical protein [Actinacidiphila sp. DG2A-62]MEC3992123.1 hypothetical protein [Actinacidiphila sp. DG2A-62]
MAGGAVHALAAAAGLAGAAACLVQRLAGRARDWAPAAVVLVVMALMAGGAGGTALPAGACAVAGACGWTALAGPRDGGRAAAVVDLAVMALLTAEAAAAGPPGHPAGMRMAGGAGAAGVFVLLVTCWVLARAGAGLAAVVESAPRQPPAPPARRARCGRVLLRDAGSAAMVMAMAAMLA